MVNGKDDISWKEKQPRWYDNFWGQETETYLKGN